MKLHFSQFKSISAWVTLVVFMLVISTGIVDNCVCADNGPEPVMSCDSCGTCCCTAQSSPDGAAASLTHPVAVNIQPVCPCGSDAAPFDSLDHYLNASVFDITAYEFAHTHTLCDTVHLSYPALSGHEYISQQLSLPEISQTSTETTVLIA